MDSDSRSSHDYDHAEARDYSAWSLIAGVALGLVWAAGVSAFLLGYSDGAILSDDPSGLAGLAFIAIAPAVVFSFAGWAM
ncbi:MAG: hypothetical protein PVI23_07895, partial [Maricaulaceae bacterium]